MLEEHALQNACAIEHLELVNDFAVLIYGLNHLQAHQQHTLVAKPAISGAPIAILGAGTGLGVAMGIPGPRGLMAMASEAAHGEFAARTDAEWQLKQWLLQDQGLERVSIERVVSGPGLGQVFRWCLSQHIGSTPHPLHQPSQLWATSTAAAPDRPDLPALVAAAAQSGDPLAQHALSIWLGAYGSVAGDLVLQSLCLGAVDRRWHRRKAAGPASYGGVSWALCPQGPAQRGGEPGAGEGPHRGRGRPVQRGLPRPDAAGVVTGGWDTEPQQNGSHGAPPHWTGGCGGRTGHYSQSRPRI